VRHPTPAALGAALLTLVLTAPPADAGPPGRWTHVTGIDLPDRNTLEVGLARTADGALHVSWGRDRAGTADSLLHSSISADARTVSGPHEIFAAPAGVNESSALVGTPEGLRVFFAATNAFDDALATATSTDGTSWSAPVAASRAGNEARPVYAASGISAARAPDGTFYSAWGSSAPGAEGFHVGLDSAAPDGAFGGGRTVTDPGVGVDSRSGAVFAAGNVPGDEGLVVLPIAPAGAAVTISGSDAEQLGHRVGVTGRIGAGGVLVAYTQGTNQFTGQPGLYRADTGRTLRVARHRGAEKVSIAAAPEGRAWVFWKDAGTVYATRSNKAVTRFGPVVAVRAPAGADTIHSLAGEGSRGPLDLLALADVPNAGIGNWHQRILPRLQLTATAGKRRKVTFAVRDAGDPVAGARVRVGRRAATTSAAGKATLVLPRGRHAGTATKPGYAAASARVTVGARR
jgi:hypothetical protein